MTAGEVLADRTKEYTTAMGRLIEDFDQARVTKEDMRLKVGRLVGDIVTNSFTFGLQIGTQSALGAPDDIESLDSYELLDNDYFDDEDDEDDAP